MSKPHTFDLRIDGGDPWEMVYVCLNCDKKFYDPREALQDQQCSSDSLDGITQQNLKELAVAIAHRVADESDDIELVGTGGFVRKCAERAMESKFDFEFRWNTSKEEGQKFEVGTLCRFRGDQGSNWGYVVGHTDGGVVFFTEAHEFESKHPEHHFPEKVGEFKPNHGFFDALNEECNGSFIVSDGEVMFDPVCRYDYDLGSTYIFYQEPGTGYSLKGGMCGGTGIVISVGKLKEIHQEE